MAGGKPMQYPGKVYYRDAEDLAQQPGAPKPVPQVGPNAAGIDKDTWNEANVAEAGPQRVLFGKQTREVEIPCAISPLGITNIAVPLVRNNFDKPMFVRVKLARNSTEGRVGISSGNTITGAAGSPMEWLDLVTAPGREFEAVLGSGNALYAIGTWPGVVPLSVFVSVSAWNPA